MPGSHTTARERGAGETRALQGSNIFLAAPGATPGPTQIVSNVKGGLTPSTQEDHFAC